MLGGGEKTPLDAYFLHLSLANLRNLQVGLSTIFLSILFFYLQASILKIRGTGNSSCLVQST